MAWPSSLAPRFVNDYVIAEITYSTVHARHEVLAWPRAAFCSVSICKIHLKKPFWLHYGGEDALWLCPLGQPQEERI